MRLIVMRHAKSAWDDPTQDDFDRPLNARGVASSRAIGRWLAGRGYIPDQVFCSSARRTRETWAYVAEELRLNALDARFEQALYLASEDKIEQVLRKATGQTVLLIAHNPGIGYFAERFALRRPDHPQFLQYPTAATTVYDVAADRWSKVRAGDNPVLDFVVPRDLSAR